MFLDNGTICSVSHNIVHNSRKRCKLCEIPSVLLVELLPVTGQESDGTNSELENCRDSLSQQVPRSRVTFDPPSLPDPPSALLHTCIVY